MNIVFACGGTGGHLIPAIAIAEVARAEGASAIFVGTGKDLERKLVTEAGFSLETLSAKAVVGGGIFGLLKFLLFLPFGVISCIVLFRRLRPDVVVGMGGYPSFIPMLTAYLLRIPTVLSEQNVQVGLANKALSLLAGTIVATEGASGFWSRKHVHELSNPVRQAFSLVKDWQAPVDKIYKVLVLGGSQGAVSLNRAICAVVDELSTLPIQIVHQSGQIGLQETESAYAGSSIDADVRVFIRDVAEEYEKAHLIICRAGAMTVAEVAASARPAVFVPLPIAGAHQGENCKALVEQGAALMIPQDAHTSELLLATLTELFTRPEKLKSIAERLSTLRSEKSSALQYWELIRALGEKS